MWTVEPSREQMLFDEWGAEVNCTEIVTKLRSSGCMTGDVGGGGINLCGSTLAAILTLSLNPSLPPFLSNTHTIYWKHVCQDGSRAGTLLSDALSHAAVCCGWSRIGG